MSTSARPMPLTTVDLASADVAPALDRALADTGFVQLVGHDLDAEMFASLRRMSDTFFALGEEVKRGFVHSDPAANRGYRARGSEALSYSLGEASPPDLFESFNAAPEPICEHRLLQSTPWPDAEVPGFSACTIAAFESMRELARRLDALIEDILDISWLGSRSVAGPDMLASINYRPNPDGTEVARDGQQRMGAHSDYTTFTILLADPVPGLQIVGPDGEWVDVIPGDGSLLLNVGDVLAILTNDRWPSTLHRVVPMSAGAAAERRSVAYFHYPDLDVEIEPLAHEVAMGEHDIARYAPITVEQHLLDKFVAPKIHRASTGASTVAGRLDDSDE